MELMRLQKYLSSAGVCSRRKGEEYIQAGRVSVNGRKVVELGVKVDPEKDRVEVDGRSVGLKEDYVYIALNKPEGYITSCSHGNEKIVIDLLDISQRVYPVGRLDKNSTGLLILTNDGRIHHKLSHPSFDHEKEYEVTVSRHISDSDLARMSKGIKLKEAKTRPCDIKRLSGKAFKITLKEGRNRQIRRMVKAVNNEVRTLKRIRMQDISLGNLKKGRWRHLTFEEEKGLLEILS